MHGISYRPTDLFSLKEFSKKIINLILFEQDCPEAVVHWVLFQLLMVVLAYPIEEGLTKDLNFFLGNFLWLYYKVILAIKRYTVSS